MRTPAELLEQRDARHPTQQSPRAGHRRQLWSVAFYGPALALPLAARLLVLSREGDDLGLASALKGAAFGSLQDAAVLLQTLIAVRAVTGIARCAARRPAASSVTRCVMTSFAALALGGVYAWLTLACAIDLALLVRFLPRLNRGFVEMYLQFSGQFASSLAAVGTPQLVASAVLYVISMVLWVAAVLRERVQLPCFRVAGCESTTASPNATEHHQPSDKLPQPTQRRWRSSAAVVQEVGVVTWAVHGVAASALLRTAFLALLAFASALHATWALDGNGNDIYLFSNAMFSLQTESFLRGAVSSRSSATAPTLVHHLRLNQHEQHRMAPVAHESPDPNATSHLHSRVPTANATSDMETAEPTPTPLDPIYERLLGRSEVFEFVQRESSDGSDHGEYPFWRKTVRFQGATRFEWPRLAFSPQRPPPTVILLNLESFRSLEVGVLGGREKLARYNQTVTPFFDRLAESGVLFARHYTPCVQTSRTLLSSLFGVLPSVMDTSAVATFAKTKLRLHGLPQILKGVLNYTSTFWSAVNLAWEDWRGFLHANGFDQLVDDVTALDYLSESRRDALAEDDTFSWGRHDPVSFEALTNYLRLHQRKVKNASTHTPPLFLDVYTISSHDPWTLPATFSPSTNYSTYLTRENEQYVHSLNFVDQSLEKLFTTLRRDKLLDNTIVLIEGDHGFGRMEHGNNPTIVASSVYDVGTHIPMLLLADDFLAPQDRGKVVEALTSQTDVLATITDLLGIENFMQHGLGQSMLREWDATSTHRDREAVLTNPFYGQTRGLRVGRDLKYARYGSGKYEVFNLTSDPLELKPVEVGKLAKNPDGSLRLGRDLNPRTAEALSFADEVVDLVSQLYDTNGFVPAQP